jgi:hypothetical protein
VSPTPIPPEQVSPYGSAYSAQPTGMVTTRAAFGTIQTTGPPPVAYSIAAAVQATGNAVSRTRMFDLIKRGEIDARKVGRRTIVLADSLRDYLARQPRA